MTMVGFFLIIFIVSINGASPTWQASGPFVDAAACEAAAAALTAPPGQLISASCLQVP